MSCRISFYPSLIHQLHAGIDGFDNQRVTGEAHLGRICTAMVLDWNIFSAQLILSGTIEPTKWTRKQSTYWEYFLGSHTPDKLSKV